VPELGLCGILKARPPRRGAFSTRGTMNPTALLLLLLPLLVVASTASSSRPFRIPLDANSTFSWILDYPAGTVSIEVHTPGGRDHWVAVGFSDYGSLVRADLCVLWRDWRGRTHMQVGLPTSSPHIIIC
jgi:hypothetical protein